MMANAHENETKFICEICSKTFSRQSVMIIHVKDVHEQSGQNACGFCDKKFLKKTAKMVHERKHTGEKPFVCDHCGKSFDRQSSLNRHNQLHGNQPYRCDNCGESFTSYKARRDGLKCEKCNVALSPVLPQVSPTIEAEDEGEHFIHEISPPIKFKEAENTSESLNFIKQEVVSKVESSTEKESIDCTIIQCEICLKTFTKLRGLNRHKKLHAEQLKEEKLVDNSKQDLKDCDDNVAVEETYLEQTMEETDAEVSEKSYKKSTAMPCDEKLTGKKQYGCDYCEKSYDIRSSLNRHCKTIHGLSNDESSFDNLIDKDENNEMEETYVEVTEKSYKKSTAMPCDEKLTSKRQHACEYCDKTYDIKSSLNRHCKAIHGLSNDESSAEKDKNNETVDESIQKLKIEETIAEDKKLETEILCTFCQKRFKTNSSLKCHVSDFHEHSGDFACGLCDKKFYRKSSKIDHERTHSGEKPFVCDECGKSFQRKSSLVEHARDFHEKENQFICDVCTKVFPRKKGLTKHLKFVHEKIKDFCCDKCSKSFSRKEHLARHVESIHEQNGENPYNCEKCIASFKRKEKLEEHFRFVHENEKNFPCETCNKRFARKAEYTRHVADIHEKSGNFSCEFCERVFFKLHDKKAHERKHTNEKPFSCNFCDKTFRAVFDKKAHERKHTGQNPYKCKKCDHAFVSKSKMYQHLKTHEELSQLPMAEQQNLYNNLYPDLSMMNNPFFQY